MFRSVPALFKVKPTGFFCIYNDRKLGEQTFLFIGVLFIIIIFLMQIAQREKN